MELHFTTQVFESLANPLFFKPYVDDTQVTDTSLLVGPIIRRKKPRKHVHWPDEEGINQPLSQLFTYIGDWDRSPIQVSGVCNSRSYQKHLSKKKQFLDSKICPYLCLAFLVCLLVLLG